MEATRRVFLTAGLAGVPAAVVVQQLSAQRRSVAPADDTQFQLALGREIAAQVRAAQAGGNLREIARSFTTTLRLHAAHWRQRGGDAALRESIRAAKANGHWQHALDHAANPEARQQALAECQRRFGVDLRDLSPAPSRLRGPEDVERFGAAILGGASSADQLDRLAGLLDDASTRLPGNINVRLEQQWNEFCQDYVCSTVWVLGEAAAWACAFAFLFMEAGAIACATAFVEYEMARFFAWLIGCYC